MKEFLKRYKIEITTIGPVHIGSGETIKKKEWLLDNKNNRAIIADTGKLFAFLQKHRLLEEFEKFFLGEAGNLQVWLKEHGIFPKDYSEFEKYSLDISGVNIKDKRLKDIALYIKDAYGMPYIPGSSLKGAIRTAILAKKIKETGYHDPAIIDQIYSDNGRNKKKFLNSQSRRLNQQIFYTGDFDQKNTNNIVNDIMKGIRVSDSAPVDCSNLTLCQKVDINTRDKETALPILRECIKPGCTITCELVIDTGITDISCEYIQQAIQEFLVDYNDMFLKYFRSETLYEGGFIYLGGGVGFASKTVTNQLLAGEANRVKYVGEIIDKTTGKRQHSGNKSVNPHIVKLTEYDRDLLQMGVCSIEFTPV